MPGKLICWPNRCGMWTLWLTFRCVPSLGLNGRPGSVGIRRYKTMNGRSGGRWLGPWLTYYDAVSMVSFLVYCIVSMPVLCVIIMSAMRYVWFYVCFRSLYRCVRISVYRCVYVYMYTYIARYVSMDPHFGVFWDFRVRYLYVMVYLCTSVYTYIRIRVGVSWQIRFLMIIFCMYTCFAFRGS